MMNFQGILGGGSTPTPQTVELDPTTLGLINQQQQQANRPTGEFQSELMKGIPERVGQLNSSGPSNMGNTGMSAGMKESLINSYGGQTGDFLNKVKVQNQMMAEQRKANALRTAAQIAMQQQSAKNGQFQTYTDAFNQMEAQRSAFIASMSGLVNYGMGTYAANHSKNVSPNTQTPDQSIAMNPNNNYLGNYSFNGGQQPQAQPSYLGFGENL